MLRSVVIVAALLSAAPAAAQDRSMAGVIPGYQPSALETALPSLESRMEAFGLQVAALSHDAGLSEEQRAARMAALWAEYGPDITRVTASAADVGLNTAGNVLAAIDIGALIEAALSQVDLAAVLAEADVQAALAEAAAALADAHAESRVEARAGGL